MVIILPHGVLFRGGAEARIRSKLLQEGHIDIVIPVCVLMLKKCKKPDDVLFINAVEEFEKGTRQNRLLPEHIDRIIATYRDRAEHERYSGRVPMDEIAGNDDNLHITRYVSTAEPEPKIDLAAVHTELVQIDADLVDAKNRHNALLNELGLASLP